MEGRRLRYAVLVPVLVPMMVASLAGPVPAAAGSCMLRCAPLHSVPPPADGSPSQPTLTLAQPRLAAAQSLPAPDATQGGSGTAAGTQQQSGGTAVNRWTFGINVATWDGYMLDPSTIPTLKTLGTGIQQFPNLDTWNWRTDRSRSAKTVYQSWNSWTEPLSLPGWGQVLQATGNHGLFIVPYGTNESWTGGESIAGVRAITRYILDHHIPVTAMVIGSEVYGWWTQNLRQRLTAQRYAQVAVQMAQAIHDLAPNMKVGVDLVAPVDPQAPQPDDVAWNRVVISQCAPYVQFWSVHSYPLNHVRSDTGLLQGVAQRIPETMGLLRSEVQRYGGSAASRVPIWITEYNLYNGAVAQSTLPVSGAALVESLLLWVTHGAHQVDWWSLHGDARDALPPGSAVGQTPMATATSTYGVFSLASEGVAPQPQPVNSLYPTGAALARLMDAIGTGARVYVQQNLLLQQHIFVARIVTGEGTTWVVINNTAQDLTVNVGGRSLLVRAAALRMWSTGSAGRTEVAASLGQ